MPACAPIRHPRSRNWCGELPVTRRIGILTSLGWGWLSLLAQLCMPVFSALLIAVSVGHLLAGPQGTPEHAPAMLGSGLFLAAWIALLLLSRGVGVETTRGCRVHKIALALLGVILAGSSLLSLCYATATVFWQFAAVLMLLVMAIVVQSRQHWRWWLRWMPLYLLLLPAFSLYLTTFSIANLSDTSWGTKGLTGANVQAQQRRRWARRRDQLLLAWMVVSVAVLALWLSLVPPSAWRATLQLAASVFFVRVAIAAATSASSNHSAASPYSTEQANT
jgi:hypothetical protein